MLSWRLIKQERVSAKERESEKDRLSVKQLYNNIVKIIAVNHTLITDD